MESAVTQPNYYPEDIGLTQEEQECLLSKSGEALFEGIRKRKMD